MVTIRLSVNGKARSVDTEPERPLLEVLREDLGLTGTKYGCGEGQCGACTVLVDGKPVRSCITDADFAVGKKVVTIEGLAPASSGHLSPLQQAFLDEEAFQCAYCTSGMIMSAHALLAKTPRPSDEDIVQYMNGNICRCGTYLRIMAAIRRAAEGVKHE